MKRRLREPFGKAGLIVAAIALVFAMFGGAYAATNNGGGKATASAKKAKKGPRGPRGKQGKPGKAGPAGPQGLAGANGKDGTNGTNGQDGAAGVSVTGAPITAGGACGTQTGVKYSLSGTDTNVCNGQNGQTGFTELLPSEKTETGTWEVNLQPSESSTQAISFPIPLETAPEPTFVEGSSAPGCSGVEAGGFPTAEPGHLCLYGETFTTGVTGEETGFSKPFGFSPYPSPGAGPTGTVFSFECEGPGPCVWFGTWAVTAE